MMSELVFSKIGLGLYQGEETDDFDAKLLVLLRESIKMGINFFDCAPNYRNTRSEKILGKLISEYPEKRVVISTKGGFVPFDFSEKVINEREYITSNYYDKGIINPDLFDDYYFQSFDPIYLEYQFELSLNRLNRNFVDIYYLHNPEYLLHRVGQKKFIDIMNNVFKWVKSKILTRQIIFFGISTWDGFFNLSLDKTMQLSDFIILASKHNILENFRYIQFPFNIGKTNAFHEKSQFLKGTSMTLIRMINYYNLIPISNAPFGQGKLLTLEFPQKLKNIFSNSTNSEICLSFALSAPFISGILLGTSSLTHLSEVVELWNSDNYNQDKFFQTFSN